MRRLGRLHGLFIKQYLKQLMEYKVDFLIGVLGVFLTQGLNILFLQVLFSHIPNLQGWNFAQIAFIYGYSLLPKGIDHLFFDNLWAVGQRLVRRGDFDKYLTRPLNPLFHVLVETFQVDALGELLVGFLLLASSAGSMEWTAGKLLLFVLSLPFATAIYTSLKIATASISFWTKQSGAVTYIFYMFNDFAKYPMAIYHPFLKYVLSFILPFAFTAYYPAAYFLTGEELVFRLGGLVLAAIICLSLSIFVWNKGLSAYESAGS
ncbi:ABC transporter permease [Streptococcus gallolyticus]|uniref:ABC transporter permease n=1 Tax=Streptococcus hepaticus TaxID=3349163 RepID=UPI001C97CC5A|nr:ABC transporter permease [Streptococcus gallolyticus]MBY5040413.1 ABC transporter permease [Streptococcus gallolyticus]